MTTSAPTDNRSRGVEPDEFGRYVRRPFRRTLRGYSPDEVDEHLRLVRGWFTLAGFDQLLAERRDDILRAALEEAEAIVQDARREAETMIERARLEARAVLEEATRRGEATTAAAQEHLASLKSLASVILEAAGAQSSAPVCKVTCSAARTVRLSAGRRPTGASRGS